MLISQITTILTFIRENDIWDKSPRSRTIQDIPLGVGVRLIKLGVDTFGRMTFGKLSCRKWCIREKDVDPFNLIAQAYKLIRGNRFSSFRYPTQLFSLTLGPTYYNYYRTLFTALNRKASVFQ